MESGHSVAYRYAGGSVLIQALVSVALLNQPAPVQCPILIAENFSILQFDSGSAELSRATRMILDGWIRIGSTRDYPTRFELTGQADRVGNREANLRLSYRRAIAVRRYLVRHGVSQTLIAVRAEGEDHPRAETADEVPEPTNRVVQLLALADPREPTEVRACSRGSPDEH